MNDVTQVLNRIDQGDPAASEQLLPLVYEALKDLAAARMAVERSDHTLQATALVHEAYARLVAPDNGCRDWQCCGHFFSAAAEAMRRILVDYSRLKAAQKRDGPGYRVAISDIISSEPSLPVVEFLDLHEALEHLQRHDDRKARVVNLRYFAGLSVEETACCLGISTATVVRDWRYARAWLHRQISPTIEDPNRNPI